MNRTELFSEVNRWLKGEKLSFLGDEDDATCHLRMNIENGLVQVRLVCEEAPMALQVICALPVKVPHHKSASTAVMLHNINRRVRIGAFQLSTPERIVSFRLPMPIRPEADLSGQFGGAFGAALSMMDEYLPPLALHLCSTSKVRATLAKLSPEEHVADTVPRLSQSRFEIN